MKSVHEGVKKNYGGTEPDSRQVAYHTFLIIPKWYENVAQGMKKAHLGMKQMPRVWYLCGVGLFRTIVNGSTHCVLFFCTRLDLFRTIETIFVRNRSIRVFLCFQVYSYTT